MPKDPPVRIGVSAWPPGVNPCILHPIPGQNCDPGIELDILLTLLKAVGIKSYTFHATKEKGCGALVQNERGEITKVSGLLQKFQINLQILFN